MKCITLVVVAVSCLSLRPISGNPAPQPAIKDNTDIDTGGNGEDGEGLMSDFINVWQNWVDEGGQIHTQVKLSFKSNYMLGFRAKVYIM